LPESIGERAPLGELAVRVDVDSFRQPFVNPPDESRVGKKLVDLCERRADHPPMVGRVHASNREAGACFHEKRLKRRRDLRRAVDAGDDRCGRDVMDDESGVGRRVEVRRQQVNVAPCTLGAFQEPGGHPDPLEERRIAPEA